MDPNAALAYLERHPATSINDASEDTKEHAFALHQWIGRGGFAPDWTKYPSGTKTYRALTGFLNPRDMK